MADEELAQKVEQIRHRLNNYGEINLWPWKHMRKLSPDTMSFHYNATTSSMPKIHCSKPLKEIESTATALYAGL